MASSLPPPPPPPPPAQTLSSTEESLGNPGTVEDLHKKTKGFCLIDNLVKQIINFEIIYLDVFPVNFDGAKLMVNKGLSNHFQISHTLNMSSLTPSGYRFGATYVGTQQYGPSEAYPILLGDIDPSGNLNANIIHQVNKNIRMKFVSQVSGVLCASLWCKL